MSETPIPSSPGNEETSTPSRAASPAVGSTTKKKGAATTAATSQIPKKVSADVLERRRVGRLKAAETMARNIKKSGIERRENPVKFSNFENVNIVNQKNYFTDYLKRDEQIFIFRDRKLLRQNKKDQDKKENTPQVGDNEGEDEEDGDEEEGEDEDSVGSRTVVIHPGARNIRIGLASDVYPKAFPFVVAVPGEPTARPEEFDLTEEESKEQQQSKEKLYKDFRDRMRYYKRRLVPNSNDMVSNYNKKIIPEKIPEHNDIHRIEFINPKQNSARYYVGEDAFKLDSEAYRLRYPLLTHGKFNHQEYKSPQELTGEIQLYLRETLKTHFDIEAITNHKTVLIIPDLYDKHYAETFIELLLQMGFDSVAIIQESLAATYGAGISNACVVDIGAKTTKIACVDDGLIVGNSRTVQHFGGDDITRNFYKLLREANFPIELDQNKPHEWSMMEQIKEKFITFQDANITVQLYNFTKRYTGGRLSEKFEFKVFDQAILSPMGLFFPKVFDIPSGLESSDIVQDPNMLSRDIFTEEADDPVSKTQKDCLEGNIYSNMNDFPILKDLINPNNLEEGSNSNKISLTPLDKALIQSIANACRYDFSKLKTYFENILIVGGGSKIEALDFILIDRINIWRPKLLALSTLPEFLKTVELKMNKWHVEKEYTKNFENKELIAELDEQLYGELQTEVESYLQSSNFDVHGSVTPVQILPAPREIDPSILTWKGGSVFARLKIIEELWITYQDWDMLGSRTLQYKTLFSY
ncbi:hypothetical protein WICPIJ_000293 [Wickerhamomyces pijperi]|uniref:Actin-related protein 8 n=1 Tax=Wickerhamomyces pijperi TaxID=599730 RepID=A0A9P8QDY5_WICPI|nr:hypothetical protein WICPIJ_000293 [Wickerhamomyces pijperi]